MFIYASVDDFLGCFQFLVITDKAYHKHACTFFCGHMLEFPLRTYVSLE